MTIQIPSLKTGTLGTHSHLSPTFMSSLIPLLKPHSEAWVPRVYHRGLCVASDRWSAEVTSCKRDVGSAGAGGIALEAPARPPQHRGAGREPHLPPQPSLAPEEQEAQGSGVNRAQI